MRICLVLLLLITAACAPMPHKSAAEIKVERAEARVLKPLKKQYEATGLRWGAPVYIRIFKHPGTLEMWVQNEVTGRYDLFKTYPVCKFSGQLGPKLKEGDRQAPEGFYSLTAPYMHPASENHLAFNIGYPNSFDIANRRTGSFIMVHGRCESIGCFAMTDDLMEEIYVTVDHAFKGGQGAVPIHIFPFPMDAQNMMTAQAHNWPWFTFWQDLKPAYDQFNQTRVPPVTGVMNKRYVVVPHSSLALSGT